MTLTAHITTNAPLPTARPLAPPSEAILPYLQQVDRARIYSNSGPLSRQLEARIADMAQMRPQSVVTTSSGTAALTALLRARVNSRPGLCLLPSWTFAATPAAALAAGLTPHFIEVDPETWALDPKHVAERARVLCPAAIVVVAPFGARIDYAAWAHVERDTGVPVVVDAAAGFDALTTDIRDTAGEQASAGCPPTIVSLHATKPMGCGEGGLVIADDQDLAVAVRRMVNFGFHGDRVTREPGFNGKLSEYHAAVGLACLDGWTDQRDQWVTAKRTLRAAVQDTCPQIDFGPDAAQDFATSTFNVILPGEVTVNQQRLAQEGINTLRWWGRGCADQPAYQRYPTDPLPQTRALASTVVGLPFYCDQTPDEAWRIAKALERTTRLGTGTSARHVR